MRAVAWFSCGAASAVAAKLGVAKYGDECEVVYCDTMASEHPDNLRFFNDIEGWLEKTITVIRSDKYETVDEVFERTRYMAGVAGARCTVEMKKIPRFDYQRADDIHIFGMTAEETQRIDRLTTQNPELVLDWILRDKGLKKKDCLLILKNSGIELPVMYQLGFKNNNCIGCVKATSARYWNMVRINFPETFEKRARQSRELGVRLTRFKGERIFLDELPPDYMADGLENISCGPECGITNPAEEAA